MVYLRNLGQYDPTGECNLCDREKTIFEVQYCWSLVSLIELIFTVLCHPEVPSKIFTTICIQIKVSVILLKNIEV